MYFQVWTITVFFSFKVKFWPIISGLDLIISNVVPNKYLLQWWLQEVNKVKKKLFSSTCVLLYAYTYISVEVTCACI